jgi:hypothetical protein
MVFFEVAKALYRRAWGYLGSPFILGYLGSSFILGCYPFEIHL